MHLCFENIGQERDGYQFGQFLDPPLAPRTPVKRSFSVISEENIQNKIFGSITM